MGAPLALNGELGPPRFRLMVFGMYVSKNIQDVPRQFFFYVQFEQRELYFPAYWPSCGPACQKKGQVCESAERIGNIFKFRPPWKQGIPEAQRRRLPFLEFFVICTGRNFVGKSFFVRWFSTRLRWCDVVYEW